MHSALSLRLVAHRGIQHSRNVFIIIKFSTQLDIRLADTAVTLKYGQYEQVIMLSLTFIRFIVPEKIAFIKFSTHLDIQLAEPLNAWPNTDKFYIYRLKFFHVSQKQKSKQMKV